MSRTGSHTSHVIGMPEREGRALLDRLLAHTTQPEFVYSHRWAEFDLVIWDNRTTMHRVRRFDDLSIVRDVRRTTTKSDGPTAAQEAA